MMMTSLEHQESLDGSPGWKADATQPLVGHGATAAHSRAKQTQIPQPAPRQPCVAQTPTSSQKYPPDTQSPHRHKQELPKYSISRSLPSPDVYQVSKGFHVGKLEELPPPSAINSQWEGGVKEELDTYLCSCIRTSPWSKRIATVESVLCMASKINLVDALVHGASDQKEIILRPTVWISCASRKCKSFIKDRLQRSTDALEPLNQFLTEHGMPSPLVTRGAPRLAATSPDSSPLVTRDTPRLAGTASNPSLRLQYNPGPKAFEAHGTRFIGGPRLAATESNPPLGLRYDLDCMKLEAHDTRFIGGNLARLSIERGTLTSEALFTIGGCIRVDDTLYGLTTAHGILSVARDILGSEHDPSDDESLESDFDDSSDLNDDATMPGILGAPSAVVEHSQPGDWTQVQLPRILAFQGQGTRKRNLSLPDPAPSDSDFALIDLDLQKIRALNPLPPDGKLHSAMDITAEVDMREEEVNVVYGSGNLQHRQICKGILLSSQSSIILGDTVIHTRKIQVPTMKYQGISGSWVIQGDKLCGIVFASYDRSPCLHMLPAESVFANIKTFLSATKVTVATIRDLEELKEWVASIFGSNEGVESTVSLENAGAFDPSGSSSRVGIVPLSPGKEYVLLIKDPSYNCWTLPIGRWQVDDVSYEDAASRETWEIGGIKCKTTRSLGVISARHFGNMVCFFEATVENLETEWPEPGKGNRRWCTYAEAVHALQNEGLAALAKSTMKR